MRPSFERQLSSLEAMYRELLLSALLKCAKGQWGLFGHNLSPNPDAAELLELGSKIERLRQKCGLEPFELHDRLLRMRSSHHSNTPGEPKLAQRWIEELT